MRAEVRQHGWQLASARAYPSMMHHAPDGSHRDLTLRDVRILEACAHGLIALVAQAGEAFRRQDERPLPQPVRIEAPMEVVLSLPWV